MEIWAYIFVAIYVAVCITFCISVFILRNNIFLKCRHPGYLISQNIGGMVCVILLGLYEAKRPDFPCVVFFLGYLCAYVLFGVPMLIRVWHYCVSYHISLLKTQYRPTFFRDWAKTSWFFRHKWIAERPFLFKFFIGWTLFTLGVALIGVVLPHATKPDLVTNSCNWKYGAFGLIFIFFYIIVTVTLGALIWRANDVYGVKREFVVIFCVWVVFILTFAIYTTPVRAANKKFSASILIMVANAVTLLICNLWPIYKAVKFARESQGEHAKSKAHFRKLLDNVDFRNIFYVFLSKQFCQENLLFYEVVMHWKDLREDDPTRQEKLRSILDVFVEENSVCQVNILDDVRGKIIETSNFENSPNSVFDEALEALVQDMYDNSYQAFRSSRRHHSADSGDSEFSYDESEFP